MALFMVNHEVKDYDSWRQGFDKDATNRDYAGIKTLSVTRSADNLNDVHVVFDVPDAAAFKKFTGSDELKQAMQAAGVISVPKIYMLEQVHH